MMKTAIRFLAVLAVVCLASSALGQSTVLQDMGVYPVSKLMNGFQTNLDGNFPQELVDASAASIKAARSSTCAWPNVETQSAPPLNVSTGYALSTACLNFVNRTVAAGLDVEAVMAYSPPNHQILSVTAPSANIGDTSVNVTLTGSVGGDTWSNVAYPYDYLALNGGSSFLTGKHFYEGSLICGITVIDSTHATLNMCSALTVALSNTALTINEGLYPSAATGLITDPSLIAYQNYVNNFLTLCTAIAVPAGHKCTAELWNEPAWANDPWDNRVDAYDSFAGTATQSGNTLTVATATSAWPLHVGDAISGSGFPSWPTEETITALGTGTGGVGTYTMSASVTVSSAVAIGSDPNLGLQRQLANFGMVNNCQRATVIPGGNCSWGGTGKSGNSNVNATRMLNASGSLYLGPGTMMTQQVLHPYGNSPEDSMWNAKALTANPALGGTANILPLGGSGVTMMQSNLQNPTTQISNIITETGCGNQGNISSCPDLTLQQPTWLLRQYLGYMTEFDGIAYYRFFDPTFVRFAGPFTIAASSGGSTTITGTFTGATATQITPSAFLTCASNACAGYGFTITNATNAANNGSWLITASTGTVLTIANPSAVAETTPSNAVAQYVPFNGLGLVQLLNSAGFPCATTADCTASTSSSKNPAYTRFQQLFADLAPINRTAPVAYTSASLDTQASYSGAYQMISESWVGARAGALQNSWATMMWQVSAAATGTCTITTPSSCWSQVASPSPATITRTLPANTQITKLIDLTTRTPVSYTMAGQNATFAIADHPIEMFVDPIINVLTGLGTSTIKGTLSVQ